MKKFILALTLIASTNIFAGQRFEMSEQVATCYLLTPQAIETGSYTINAKADAKCKKIGSKLTAVYDSYLEVHSMNNRSYCGGVEVSRFFICRDK